jgi:hypothetical protein
VTSNVGRLLVAAAAVACGSSLTAQAPQTRQVPKGWSYDVNPRGQRVDRTNRVTRADGSWREEIRQGKCVTVKERSAAGEYKETRQCSPGGAAAPQ